SARHKQTAIVRMLLAAGADPNSTEYRGATPLIAAAASDDFSTEMIALLLDAGADPRAKDKSGQTALDWAMKRGETAVTGMLRKAVEAQ
ncbi:MAG: ankyrin repeat domain-containing protein, partial [Bryobacteraceae bacterium]|nr:ankyrin repeat domain-containing protein [Bryobacteraceae bacterium]